VFTLLGQPGRDPVFSIVQRKATLPGLARHLMDFGQHDRDIARPFGWTFTRVLDKITQRAAGPLAFSSLSIALPDASTRQTIRKHGTAARTPKRGRSVQSVTDLPKAQV
jgi:hypothetical protein